MNHRVSVIMLLVLTIPLISGCLDEGTDEDDGIPFYMGEWSISGGASSEPYTIKIKVEEDGKCRTYVKNNNMWDSGYYIGMLDNDTMTIGYTKSEIRVCQTNGQGEVIARTRINTNETWTFSGDALTGTRVIHEGVDIGAEENFEPGFYNTLPSTKTSTWTGVRTSKVTN
jgi:hypothetical protein